MDLSANPRLERTRDLFLIGAFTGMRFSDYSEIRPENIRPIEDGGKTVTCIVKTTQKTGRKVFIPMTNPNLIAILERNGMKAPPKISNQKLNDYTKELCQIAGFDSPVEITEFRAGRQSSQVFKKYELVGTHTARRSFATNALKRGLPINEIMKFTGHTTMASFLKYVKTTGEETAVSLADHQFFTGKKDDKQADAEGRKRD
jgi:integrase